ncbi:MAG: hypothetical protein WB239_18450 [Acidimicrobiia bacterium]
MHLHWEGAPDGIEASVELEIVEPPSVARLYFWALQVGFRSSSGPGKGGGAHLGLQWNPRHRGSTAVNWGGYDRAGHILDGTTSPVPSSVDDPNTRTWTWQSGRPYRLRVFPGSRSGWWWGEVTDLATGRATRVRELAGGGDRLSGFVVWSEVFAACDDPSVVARWNRPGVLTKEGRRAPTGWRVNYQDYARGGCTNTCSQSDDTAGVVQITNTSRRVFQGELIPN